jgi:putative membrane protein insertion efficiency factor
MKQLFIFLITIYQYTLSPIFTLVLGAKCRYEMSCSEFAKRSILKLGLHKGGILALRRLLSCQPFGTIHKQYEHI